MSGLRFRDLGPLEIEENGAPRPVGGTRLEEIRGGLRETLIGALLGLGARDRDQAAALRRAFDADDDLVAG